MCDFGNGKQNNLRSMSCQQKLCLICLNEIHDGIEIFGEVGKALNVWEVIAKYFWFDLMSDVDSMASSFVCSCCWRKVKSFHEFYLMVEAIHNRCESETGEEPQEEACNEEEQKYLDEIVIEDVDDVQPIENAGQEIDMLDYGTNIEHGEHLDESMEQPLNGETSSYQETKQAIESHLNSDEDLELDTETVLKLSPEHIPATKHRRLQTIKIHEITPLQGESIPNKSVPRRKRGRPRKSERENDGIVFCCYICHESFPTSQALRKHFLLHDQEESQNVVCKTCDKEFASENLLRNHMKNVHERQKRNKKNYHDTICPICEEVMKFGDLKSHIERHHTVVSQKREKFVCKICAKICTSSDAFTKHAWTHMNEDLSRVQCDICGKWLKNHYTLKVHKDSHQNAVLSCVHCGKVKFSEVSLKSHIAMTHSTRKLQCTVCDKSFARSISLKEHMAIHTGESLYNCSYCSKTFKSNANMYKHMRELHTEQWNIDRAMRRLKK